MAEVTREMILDYMIRKGGTVKNVDLVRHFRKYLQLDNPGQKERAREIFKERVNQVAYIRVEKGEKCLYLKQEYLPAGELHRPPSGRVPSYQDGAGRHPYPQQPLQTRDSLTFLQPEYKSVVTSSQPPPSHVSGQSNATHYGYKSMFSPPPQNTAVTSSSLFSPPPPTTSSSLFSPPPPTSSSLFSPPPPTTSSPLFASPPSKPSSTAADDPESLLAQMTAELSNFGAGLFSSFSSSSSPSGTSSVKPVPTPPTHAPASPPHVPTPPTRDRDRTTPPRAPTSPAHGRTPPPHAPTSPARRRTPPRHGPAPSSQAPPTSYSTSHVPPPPISHHYQGTGQPPSIVSPPLANSIAHSSSSMYNSHPPAPSPPATRRLGPAVGLPSSPTAPRRSAPVGGFPSSLPTSGMFGHPPSPPLSSLVFEDRRQGSWDGGSPHLRVDSPLHFQDSSRSNGVSPPTAGKPPLPHHPTSSLHPRSPESRPRASSGPLTNGQSVTQSLGVPLRREHSPKEGKAGRPHSSATSVARRSRNFEKNVTLDSITRASIAMTPPTVRKSRPPVTGAPTVAPKPWRDLAPGNSGEDLATMEGDDEGSLTALSEDYYEIDPLEKEWMMASVQGDMERLHRLIMTDPTLVNRRDFLHGYTAMHWAAKQGRCDMITGLIMNGAVVDIKSGFTPLHLAAQGGHNNAIHLLIREHGASVNARDHSGRRPIDMVSPSLSQDTKALLAANLNSFGVRTKRGHTNLATFSQPHGSLPMHRQWSSVGDLVDRRVDPEKLAKKRLSPRMSIRKTFSFRTRRKPLHKRDGDDKRVQGHSWDV